MHLKGEKMRLIIEADGLCYIIKTNEGDINEN